MERRRLAGCSLRRAAYALRQFSWDLRSMCLQNAYLSLLHKSNTLRLMRKDLHQLHVRAAGNLYYADTWPCIDGPVNKTEARISESHAFCRGITSRRGGGAGSC